MTEDVNWRHMMRASLQQNTEMVRAIAETIPMGLSVTDKKGQFIAVNKRLCDMLGYESQELLNNSFTVILPKDDREQAIKSYQWFLAGAEAAPETENVETKFGGRLNIKIIATTFMGRNGRPYKVTCYLEPISV